MIAHRGIKNIMYDNSLVGIMLAIFKGWCTEFDILYADGRWKVCHDFGSLTAYHNDLKDLLALFRQYKHYIKKTIIIDVKWDFIRNRDNNLHDAVGELCGVLNGFEDLPLWIQASNHRILNVFLDHHMNTLWKLGMIVSSMDDFHLYKDVLHYIMVSLRDFPLGEIKDMSKECLVMGYTCQNMSEISNYKHLFRHINGIVCDVYV